jgi:hypothetical protein
MKIFFFLPIGDFIKIAHPDYSKVRFQEKKKKVVFDIHVAHKLNRK